MVKQKEEEKVSQMKLIEQEERKGEGLVKAFHKQSSEHKFYTHWVET